MRRGVPAWLLLLGACAPGEETSTDDGLVFTDFEAKGCSGQFVDPADEYAYVLDAENGVMIPANPRSCTAADPIPVGSSPTSPVVTASGHWIYVGDREDTVVSVIRQSEDRVDELVDVGFAPDLMMLDAAHKLLWVANRATGAAVRLETEHHTIVDRVQLPAGLDQLAVTDGGAEYLLTLHDDGAIQMMDAVTLAEAGSVHLGGAPASIHYAVGVAKSYVCVDGDEPYIAVIPATGSLANVISRRIPLDAPCAAIRMNSVQGLGVAVMPDRDEAIVLDPTTDTVIATISVGSRPDSVAIAGRHAVVGNGGSGDVSVLDLDELVEVARPDIGGSGGTADRRMQDGLDLNFVYALDPADGTVTVVDVRDGSTRLPISVGAGTGPMVVAGPRGGKCH
ncbi:MAG: hypothetical protein H6738_20030 [Alphaproteobacteria bacterium]|nr:hypothetical protein [Alphaproteobacteria bacterium]MCB9699081.1 hypothetical protein [Alphaproteobacteria bacterium]